MRAVFFASIGILVGALAWNQPAKGTVILAWVHSDSIVVAVDGVAVRMHDDGTQTLLPICKIRKIDENIYLAAHGLGIGPGYDPFELAREAFESKLSLQNKVERFEQAALAQIRQKYIVSREASHGNFKANPAGVIFFAVANGAPVIITRTFRPKDSTFADTYLFIERATRTDVVTGPEVNFPGFDSTYQSPGGIVAAFREYLLRASAQFPDQVGPPFSILVIRPDGVTWIEKGNCENNDP